MIKLYIFGPGFGVADVSPFGMKTRMQLAMADVPHEVVLGGYPKAPKGKLPFIEDDERVVADSTFIRAYIEERFGVDLDAGLSTMQRAVAWSTERMLEDHLYWLAAYYRWLDEANFERGPTHFFDDMPAEMADDMRNKTVADVRAGMHAHGISRHTEAEMIDLARRDLDSLDGILSDQDFLFGERATAVDATMAGMIISAACPLFISPLRSLVETYPRLLAHSQRMLDEFMPDAMPATA